MNTPKTGSRKAPDILWVTEVRKLALELHEVNAAVAAARRREHRLFEKLVYIESIEGIPVEYTKAIEELRKLDHQAIRLEEKIVKTVMKGVNS